MNCFIELRGYGAINIRDFYRDFCVFADQKLFRRVDQNFSRLARLLSDMEYIACIDRMGCLDVNFQAGRLWEEHGFPLSFLNSNELSNKYAVCRLQRTHTNFCIHIGYWISFQIH